MANDELQRQAQANAGAGEGNAQATQGRIEVVDAGKPGGVFERINQRFNDALYASRGELNRHPAPRREPPHAAQRAFQEPAPRRSRSTKQGRMVIPGGTVVQGSIICKAETEIAGQVNGDVTIEADLWIHAGAAIAGSVRATNCRVDGHVEGTTECAQNIEVGQSGTLRNDAVAEGNVHAAGQIQGNIACAGLLRLSPGAEVAGDVHCGRIIIDEGAVFNGGCRMRAPMAPHKAVNGPKSKPRVAAASNGMNQRNIIEDGKTSGRVNDSKQKEASNT